MGVGFLKWGLDDVVWGLGVGICIWAFGVSGLGASGFWGCWRWELRVKGFGVVWGARIELVGVLGRSGGLKFRVVLSCRGHLVIFVQTAD